MNLNEKLLTLSFFRLNSKIELNLNYYKKGSNYLGKRTKASDERGLLGMSSSFSNRLRCSAAVAAIAVFATDVSAQESEGRRVGVDQITVTAQKKEENLQETPLAVGVIRGDYLDASRITDLEGVTQRIAGFAYQQENRTQTAVALRGAGSLEDSPGADPAVGFFIDGVYMGNPATFDFNLLDLERVEVLRGPQGTTFGRNVVGGAINFITRTPTDELTARANLTFGKFNRFDINGNVSGPIIEDTLFGLASFSSSTSDGYTANLTTGTMLDQIDQQSGRVKLRFTPTDYFENTISADYMRDTSVGFSRVLTGPGMPIVGTLAPNDLTSVQDFDGGYDTTAWGINNNLTISFGESGELVSVTGYRENDINTAFEIDGTAASILTFRDQMVDIKEFTQELRILNTWGRLDYIAGVYYYNQEISRLETIDESLLAGSAISDLLFSGAVLSLTEVLGQNVDTDSFAVFAQGTYNISDTLRAHVGGRYTWEEKTGNTLCVAPGLQCGVVYDVPINQDWSAFTPKFTLDANLTEDIFAYATVSRGFKSGGFASGFDDPASAAVPFDPEFAWNYEIGFKTMWFDDRVLLNLTGFYVEYDDLQVRAFGSGVNAGRVIVGNAGSAHNLGLELETVISPIENLNFFTNYTYQDAEYDSLILEGEDFSGNTPLLTPKHSLVAGVEYTVDLPGGSAVTFLGDFSRKSVFFGRPNNELESSTKFDGIINASVEFTFPNEHWSVQVSGKNLRNERAPLTRGDFGVWALSAADVLSGETLFSEHLTAPRTWAVSLKYRY